MLASSGTAWLNQHRRDRAQRIAQEDARREKLHGDFTGEAAKLFADAPAGTPGSPAALVPLHAMLERRRVFARDGAVRSADAALHRIAQTQCSPNEALRDRPVMDGKLDVPAELTAICPDGLKGWPTASGAACALLRWRRSSLGPVSLLRR